MPPAGQGLPLRPVQTLQISPKSMNLLTMLRLARWLLNVLQKEYCGRQHGNQFRQGTRRSANADTPGFKARDIDFRSVLAAADADQIALKTTQAGHIGSAGASPGGAELLYRVPVQPSLDGNTVNSQVEQAQFAENAVRYQSTLTFLGSKFQGLKLAIKGD